MELFIFALSFVSIAAVPQCRDENGSSVDWYFLYKLPRTEASSNRLIRDGLAYLYMTSDTYTKGWTLSSRDISKLDSMTALTLAPFYKNASQRQIWTMYNDQPPNGAARAYNGHAKGVAMADQKGGFWMVHSVPSFPPASIFGAQRRSQDSLNITEFSSGKYDYPVSGQHYGQSVFCVSVNATTLDAIGEQLMRNEVIVYRYNTPENLAKRFPLFAKAANQTRFKNNVYNSKVTLQSLRGTNFVSFAKSDKWMKGLYTDFVAPQLQTSLLTETWQNGRGKLPSFCTKNKVLNVKSIHSKEANIDFTSTKDHSKWAVSYGSRNSSWVCACDINRADTQFSRGGGAVCTNIPEVWQAYRNLVNDIEFCP